MNEQNFSSDGIEVSILDLLVYLGHRIILLLVLIAVGVVLFFGLHGVNNSSSYVAELNYLMVPKQNENEDPTVESKYFIDMGYLLKSDNSIINLAKKSGIDKSVVGDLISYNYPGDGHSFNVAISSPKKEEIDKLVPIIKSEFAELTNNSSYFKSEKLIKEVEYTNTNRQVNKTAVIIACVPFVIGLLYFCIRFISQNPVISKKNLKRILPEVDCYEYSFEPEFDNDIVRIGSKFNNDEFINIEAVNFINSDEVLNITRNILKNVSQSLIVFEIDNSVEDNNEISSSDEVAKVNYATFEKFLSSKKYEDIKSKNQIITIESINGNESIGYRLSCLTKNNLLIFGTNEKKKNIKNLIIENICSMTHLKSIILFPNFDNKKGGKHK